VLEIAGHLPISVPAVYSIFNVVFLVGYEHEEVAQYGLI